MKIEKSKYFVLRLKRNKARIVSMSLYPLWQAVISDNDVQCPNITREEARAFIKIMGLEDVTGTWVEDP